VVLRDFLHVAESAREVKYLLTYQQILIDGKVVKDNKQQVGFMDVLSIPSLKKNFRCTVDEKGRLKFIEIDDKEAGLKLLKINNIVMIKKGKVQLCLSDGRNMLLSKKEYKTGDVLMIATPKIEVKEHLKMESGCTIFLFKGKHTGTIAKLEKVDEKKIFFKTAEGTFETNKEYALVVGKDKPLLKVT
jgi:small subunit ribosomal protein S4e